MDRRELLRIRKAMNVTQAQMADLLRLPLATIRKLEAGMLAPPLSKKIVRTLISLDFWLAKTTDRVQAPGKKLAPAPTPEGDEPPS
jgi:transcriptional regulator with XRE-family HTH domain